MVLPGLAAVTIGLVWLLSLGVAQMRTVDAARETARSLARGDDPASARLDGQRVGLPGTTLTVATGVGRIQVTASARVRGPGGILGVLPSVTVRAEAVAVPEPGAAPGPGASG